MIFGSSNQSVIARKLNERTELLKSAPSIVPVEHTAYLKATGTEIVANISRGSWTASACVEAYIARAAQAHAATNCLTEILFDQARRRAQELDEEFAATKQLRGPLHGVPISIKDQYEVVGVDATIGFTQWAGKPSEQNAEFAQALIDAGAIPIAKTNVPQTMLAFECSNPLWGRTLNPHGSEYTCGGSSGGEGALLSMDGSALGLGSDIGGSLRIPATFCGIYSLKPGFGRISKVGTKGVVPGFEGIKSVLGPMARSVDDIELACRIAFGHQSQYRDIPPLPYRDIELPQKLKFGYYVSDNYVKASPACQRAVLKTVEALRQAGHECTEIELPDASEAFNIFVSLTSSDGFKTMLSHLGPDPKESSLAVTILPSLPGFVRGLLAWFFETVYGDPLYANALRNARTKSVTEYWKLTAKRDDYIRKFYDQVWFKYGLDGIIAPTQAIPQLRHGGCMKLSSLAGSTILYNVVDSPVGCIPVTTVDPEVDQITEEWVKGPGHGTKTIEGWIYNGKNAYYDPTAMKGMPVGIQVVGKAWEDEKVVSMMKIVDKALGEARGFGPGSIAKLG